MRRMKPLDLLLSDCVAGYRLTPEEASMLFKVKGSEVFQVARAADEKRHLLAGDPITFVRNQNINCTNICSNQCGFCGFARQQGENGAYMLSAGELSAQARLATERHVTEICTVSGLHPAFMLDSYLDNYKVIKAAAPHIHLHASNPMEVAYAARKSMCSTHEVLTAFKEAGVETICGTAAEILSDPIRAIICPGKISTNEWIRIIREAHSLGMKSTATIMYGHCESEEDRAEHLSILRTIQDETHGFTEFVPLSFVHQKTAIYKNGTARPGATGREDMLMLAVSRLFLDNFRNIQVSWVKYGMKMAQIGLIAGANDLGGTLYEESISREAGAVSGSYMDPSEMEYIATDLGRTLKERRTDYTLI
ncbi:5-amino-6-(D-ribitylamino)uracil--L-tyrosine 4-hydroxyphenyl transferase CofH [Methanospirillum lacunae]|uniref:7,8-didemethyl-8-hydroxy-5-deazariboflavin synthase subunit CofH n=1 Tax=Methanospirillum lacunae TaxID=668570 RepID=A0A2V2MTT3_9EURY|nr:5-amino-6-(D-ribitylamino)uracil--L-tyrosine 4-hydroxyphenyl transferase CofH [Methanospirillum lacunae]PWR71442.1 7,8-didemethyl-8-hydroxy-5-deazariboflavin synthase subunit CofH [Methanospirillum lacunae]